MNNFTRDILGWPLWSQLVLLVVVALVAHFWFGRLIGSLQRQTTGWLSGRLWYFIRSLLWAFALSWLAVRFCVGTNAHGEPYEWGFYGRVLFVGLTAYMTNLLTRYFS